MIWVDGDEVVPATSAGSGNDFGAEGGWALALGRPAGGIKVVRPKSIGFGIDFSACHSRPPRPSQSRRGLRSGRSPAPAPGVVPRQSGESVSQSPAPTPASSRA